MTFFTASLVFITICICFWLIRPKCINCESRIGFRYKHSRVDGGPDRRHNNNYLICSNCGATKSEKKPWDDIEHPDHPNPIGVVSCHYIILPGHRKFKDCPDFPKNPGEKCKKCRAKDVSTSAIE